MIYIELSQDSNIAYLSVDGIEKNNKFYDVGVLGIDVFSYNLNQGQVKLSNSKIIIAKKYLSIFDFLKRVFDITICDINDNKIFKGRAIIIDEDDVSITLILKTKDYDIKLLENAPDLNDLTQRVFPRAFGIGKYVNPLLLDDVNLIYHAAYGNVQAVYDDGVSVSFTDNGDGTFTLSNQPVGEISMDVNSANSSIIEVAQFIAGKLGISLNSQYAKATSINYFAVNQENILDFFSKICNYVNHFFYINNLLDSDSLVLFQKYLNFSDIPDEIKIPQDGFSILKDGVQKTYNNIIKQFKATWEKRQPIQNPVKVKREQATLTVDTGFNTGEILDVQVYDYFDENILNILNEKKGLNNLHQVEVKLGGNILFLKDIGKVIEIKDDTVIDDSQNNWVQILELEQDYKEGETRIKGIGQVFWR